MTTPMALSLLLLVVACAAADAGSLAAPKRQVRMYWSKRDPQKNLVTLPAGPPSDYITGVILCCNLASIDYTDPSASSHFVGQDISALVATYKALNLTVHVCAGMKPTEMDTLPKAKASIPALVSWASKQGVDGVVIDYEAKTEYTSAHVAAYVDFLHELGPAMRAAGMEAACDLASWGILNKWSAYAKAGLDFVTTMSSWYQGKDLSVLRANTEAMLSAGFEPAKVHLGISNQCPQPKYQNVTCGWTEAKLASWFGYLEQRGLSGVDIWTPDAPQNTPSWMFEQFKTFLHGGSGVSGVQIV